MQFVSKITGFFVVLVRIIAEIFREIGLWFTRTARRTAHFVRTDHRYVYLGTSVLFAVTLWLLRPYFGAQPEATSLCLLYHIPRVLGLILLLPCAVFVLLSLAAFVAKLTTKRAYGSHPFFKSEKTVRLSRYLSYYVWAVFVVAVLDAVVLRFLSLVKFVNTLDRNPTDFFRSMIYMTIRGGDNFRYGIRTTIVMALIGTVFGFLLALLMVFLRIQTVDKRDPDWVKFLKTISLGFSKTYITVIRGTPMMVQSLIIYFAGTSVVQALFPNATVSQQLAMWPAFLAGAVTVSLNSTAYLAEVLRGGVEAIDHGQVEAARSLGLSQWQAMIRVVFPQAVKNSVPAIGNEFIINIKDSSVLNVIGVIELMFSAKTVCGIYYKYLPVYCVVALIYLCLTFFATKLLNVVASTLGAPHSRGIPSSN
jgi:putative lysine transport system permease protein